MTDIEQDQPPTAVERYFFSPLYRPSSAWDVVKWWESRRLTYNVAVGTAGMITTAVAAASMLLFPQSGDVELIWIPAIVIYGVMANVCYTVGAPVDLLLRRHLRERAPAVGQALFRYGFAFAVGLTLLPVPFIILGAVVGFFIRS